MRTQAIVTLLRIPTLGGALAAPEAPVITAPAAGSVATSLTPEITWSRSATDLENGSTLYDVDVASNSDFSTIVQSTDNVNGTSWTVGAALQMSYTVYYVRVVAHNAAGSATSDSVTVRVDPRSLTKTFRYWDVNLSGLFTDEAGTTPATAGQAVANVDGLENSIDMTSAANQPTLTLTDAQLGKALAFGATSYYATGVKLWLPQFDIFMVIAHSNLGAARRLLGCTDNANNMSFVSVTTFFFGLGTADFTGTENHSFAGTFANDTRYILRLSSNGSTLRAFANGTEITPSQAIGAGYGIVFDCFGLRNGGTYFAAGGRLSHLLICNSALTDEEASNVNSFLA